MESVLRGLIVYLFLLLVFRLAGKRTLAQTTNFELVLLLIISETIQQAMVNDDHSVTNGFLLIITLVGTGILLSIVKQKFPTVEKWLDGVPTLIIEGGKRHRDRMEKARVDEEDILEAARELQGLERLEQIKYAILERDGQISIVPTKDGRN
ncbi:MAG: DUF421 domain-containing protein [Pyrinomonadaceae bacterium]